MPSFEIVELDKNGKPRSFPTGVFPDGATAASILPHYQATFPLKKLQVRPIADQAQSWEEREAARFASGQYEPLGIPELVNYPKHFAHRSPLNRTNVEFTPNVTYARMDKKQSMPISTYINSFFSSQIGVDARRKIIFQFTGEDPSKALKFATTADEIEWVYVNGPNSCMGKPASYFSSDIHPVRVYAGPDLQVAYLQDPDGRITARSVVFPARNIHARIYGDILKMEMALMSNGYSPASGYSNWEGARLTHHEHDGEVVCPYLDFHSEVGVEGDYLVVGAGELECQGQDGYARSPDYRDNDYDYNYDDDY